MPLADKAEVIRANLGMEPGTPIIEISRRALVELGLEKYASSTLIEQIDAAYNQVGGGAAPPVLMGEAIMGMPVAQAQMAEPMAQPIAPVLPVPAQPVAQNNAAALAPGLKHASEMAGCWGCFCIPGGVALEAKLADGPDSLIHKGVAWLPICPFGLPYEDRWNRIGGTNIFQKEGADDKLNYGASSCFVCLGPGASCKVGPTCLGTEHKRMSAAELAGQWCCVCLPFGWASYRKDAQGEDTLQHKGLLCCFGVLPIPFDEPWDRMGNRNTFAKRGDANSKAIYFSRGWTCPGLLGCDIKLG